MKYLVMLCDGMADEPNAQLDNSTPMAKAVKPCMDYLASKGEVGMVKTVAEGLKPGSDVANLSVLGYEPAVYYSGRSPLEAASIGIDLKDRILNRNPSLAALKNNDENNDCKYNSQDNQRCKTGLGNFFACDKLCIQS